MARASAESARTWNEVRPARRAAIPEGLWLRCQSSGKMFIKGREAMVCCLDLTFMMGSMGSVVGETVTRCIEEATRSNLPLVIVSCSGGARMQESGLSLMQMAKSSAALARYDDSGG